jgi:hypothetical protein
MQRIRLVLPEGSELPKKAEEAAICEGLSSIGGCWSSASLRGQACAATGPTTSEHAELQCRPSFAARSLSAGPE